MHPQSSFFEKIVPEMKRIALFAVKAAYGKIDPGRKDNSFEVFSMTSCSASTS